METSETSFYQVYNSQAPKPAISRVSINLLDGLVLEDIKPKTKKPFTIKLARMFVLAGIVLLLIYFVPSLIEFTKSKISNAEADTLARAAQNATSRDLPAFNSTLPKTNRLVVPSIGVDTDIEEATLNDYETALKEGVWRVSDFGQPDKIGVPVILAAHRYGYLAWTNSYRHLNSFYNLPKVKVGDTIEIDWQQRKYVYGVYKVETSTEITDYSGDLILYTCESLSGDERVFVYAKLI